MTTNPGATIHVNNNGPYVLTGTFTIEDADGKAYRIERERVLLCRCGQSDTKPFCSGNHRTNGFASECVAPD